MRKLDDMVINLTKDTPFNVPCFGFHVTLTQIYFDDSKRDKSTHHLVMGAKTEAEAIASVQQRYCLGGPTGYSERWTAERCVRMNAPDEDNNIVFKL